MRQKRGELFESFVEYKIKNDTMYSFINTTRETPTIILWFDGSNDIFDWASNLWAYPPRDNVHASWYESAKRFRSTIAHIVAYYNGCIVLCCGTSRGGALSVETHRFLNKFFKEDHVRVFNCITSGCPPIGGQAYIDEMTTICRKYSVLNILHPDDIVPRLPMLKKFKRFGDELILSDAPKRNSISAHLNYDRDIESHKFLGGEYDTFSNYYR